jgi:hypothetical protein
MGGVVRHPRDEPQEPDSRHGHERGFSAVRDRSLVGGPFPHLEVRLGAAILLSRTVESFLFGVSLHDAASFLGFPLALVVAAAANYFPARALCLLTSPAAPTIEWEARAVMTSYHRPRRLPNPPQFSVVVPGSDSLSAVSTAMTAMSLSPNLLSTSGAMVWPTTTARSSPLTYTS